MLSESFQNAFVYRSMWTNTVMKTMAAAPLKVCTLLRLRGLHSATSVTPNRVYYVTEWKWFGLKVTQPFSGEV